MMRNRASRRFAALAAAFALMLQALWPLLSHARPKDPSLLVPVCTVDGVTHYLEIKSGETPLDERSAQHGDHCKLCVFEGERSTAIFPQNGFVLPSSKSKDAGIIVHPTSPSKPLSHSPSRPRAPPQSS